VEYRKNHGCYRLKGTPTIPKSRPSMLSVSMLMGTGFVYRSSSNYQMSQQTTAIEMSVPSVIAQMTCVGSGPL